MQMKLKYGLEFYRNMYFKTSVFEILSSVKLLCFLLLLLPQVSDINKSYNYISNLLHLFINWPILMYEGKYDEEKGEHYPG